MEKRVKGRKLTLKLWDRIIGLFQCIFQFFYITCFNNWKDWKKSFALSWAMVQTCSNFGYEDFWAFLEFFFLYIYVCVYIIAKKKKKSRDFLEFIILEIEINAKNKFSIFLYKF